jgi:aspartate/methionine/tyrosine aminotransferase
MTTAEPVLRPAARVGSIGLSPIRVFSQGAPPDAIPMGLGEPTWELPLPARKALAQEAGPCGYGPNAGLPELRKAIALWHGATMEEVLVTCGSEAALFSLLMAWLGPGDEVLVPDPGFTAYPILAKLAQAVAVPFPLSATNRFQLDAKAFIACLTEHPKAKVAILNHPSNPTGGGASLEDLQAVAWACRQRGILLISDEVYRDLHFGVRPPSLRDADDYGVVLSSMSKGWAAPGLRVGWAVGDPRWLAPATTIHAFAVTAASAPSQRAALALLEASDEVLPQGRREIAARWEALATSWQEAFGEHLTPPAGSFYHWMRLPLGPDPMAFCLQLRDEAKVVLVPGTAFGEGGRGYARLSFAARPEQIREGIRRLATLWRHP